MKKTTKPILASRTELRTGRRARSVRLGALLFASLAGLAGIAAVSPSATAATRSVSFVIYPTQSVGPGSTAQYPFAIRTSGRVGAVSFSVTGAPSDFTTSVTGLGNGNYVLSVDVPANASPGTKTLTIRTRSLASTRSTSLRLVVTSAAPPITPPSTTPTTTPTTAVPTTTPPTSGTFTLRADNPSLVVRTGQTAPFGFSVDRSGGYTGPVTFAVSGFVSGITANFAPNPTAGGSVLYVTASAGVPEGQYAANITATSNSQIVRTASVLFTVANPFDFALAVPSVANVAVGGTASVTVGYQIVGVRAPVVSLGLNGAPSGVSVTFTPNPTTGDATLTFVAALGTVPGSYPVSVVGYGGVTAHTYSMTLNVFSTTIDATPIGGFGLSATPFALAVSRGSSGNYAVGILPTGGFNSAVSFGVSGLPAGVSVSVIGSLPNFTLVVTVPSTVAAGTYPLVLTGTSGTVSSAAALQLNVV